MTLMTPNVISCSHLVMITATPPLLPILEFLLVQLLVQPLSDPPPQIGRKLISSRHPTAPASTRKQYPPTISTRYQTRRSVPVTAFHILQFCTSSAPRGFRLGYSPTTVLVAQLPTLHSQTLDRSYIHTTFSLSQLH